MKKTAPIVKTEEIQYYLKDLKKIPVISHEREYEIFKSLKEDKSLTKADRQKLTDEVVKGNLRFVISVAKTYQNQGLELPDLIAEGNLGLMKAIENNTEDENSLSNSTGNDLVNQERKTILTKWGEGFKKFIDKVDNVDNTIEN